MRKIMSLWFAVLIPMAVLVLLGCESEPERQRTPPAGTTTAPAPTPAPAPVTPPATTSQIPEAARDTANTLERRINELDQKVDSLRTRMANFSDERKEDLDQLMRSLETRKEIAQERLASLKAASAETWQNLQASTERAVDDLQESFNALEARLQ